MKLGYSSALAFALFVIIFILSLLQLKITKGNSDE
jgi:multiple sugar transport system permease protein